jgi:hypothetical protein
MSVTTLTLLLCLIGIAQESRREINSPELAHVASVQPKECFGQSQRKHIRDIRQVQCSAIPSQTT